jgi:hypothetical protein
MRHLIAIAALAGTILAAGITRTEAADAQAAVPTSPSQRPAHFTLVDAAPSVDALIDRLLDALANSDLAALHRLRVTEDEYRKFLLPGGGAPGQPPPTYDDASSDFAWQMLNTNSRYAASGIIKGYGGRKYKVKEATYLKGRQEYAWYTAYRTLSLSLEDETGTEHELVLGSIADVDGQYKFVSLLGKR